MTTKDDRPRAALIDAIDAELPQTQCGKCGQPGCLPYAEAIVDGETINRCPPGGDTTVARLAALTGRATLPLAEPAQSPLAAVIREAECIGCTKCLQACPVDAILGAAKRMHTVIVDECTGCELCVAPCPVDCIDLLPHPAWQAAESEHKRDAYLARRAEQGRRRHRARQQRLAREARERRLERQKRLLRQRPGAGSAAGPGLQRRRQLAVKAAEQALRRTRQQLAHAERQGEASTIEAARGQVDSASRLLDEARKALEGAKRS
ncbi:RnfABCDGE type electron transport complex subunit B [Halomonas ventosae]|uniref:Electron transport complex protein RnfB n=1 Tax=Halomonas ventosae TaxID=229007 RepID=A0A4R6GT63_9GAMM|nr:RnfABCDGE type electron transport complex subunit B [Halomonas ventosae]TDN98443.1 electron transport complex protein RnfB [Halomonas ventosae]